MASSVDGLSVAYEPLGLLIVDFNTDSQYLLLFKRFNTSCSSQKTLKRAHGTRFFILRYASARKIARKIWSTRSFYICSKMEAVLLIDMIFCKRSMPVSALFFRISYTFILLSKSISITHPCENLTTRANIKSQFSNYSASNTSI